MRLLVFQHIACEHPGSLRQFLKRDGIEWNAVNLDQDEAIPNLDDYDALWVMGGPMDVWDVEKYPWLVPEKAAIREWVSQIGRPFLGLCLGHQLLADALGGTCGPQHPPEIGILEIQLTAEGCADPLFAGVPEKQKCLQWHSVRVAQPPQDSVVLARSDLCSVQAMRVGKCAWSMQYHVEIESDTVANWAQVPAYRMALIETLGDQGFEALSSSADQNMLDVQTTAKILYSNFMSFARG